MPLVGRRSRTLALLSQVEQLENIFDRVKQNYWIDESVHRTNGSVVFSQTKNSGIENVDGNELSFKEKVVILKLLGTSMSRMKSRRPDLVG